MLPLKKHIKAFIDANRTTKQNIMKAQLIIDYLNNSSTFENFRGSHHNSFNAIIYVQNIEQDFSAKLNLQKK